MTKIDRVYAALMEGNSYNFFEAAILLHDHVLRTTVATLQQKHRISISRQYEIVRGYQGNPTSVCRYWITTEERQRIINRRQTAVKEAAIPTDQDKESGLQPNVINPTDEQAKSQTSSELGK